MERRSYDVAIGLSAALFDPSGQRLASAAPRWEIRNAKSAISLEGTTLTKVSESDNPLGDALRKVVADSVDALLAPATAMRHTSCSSP